MKLPNIVYLHVHDLGRYCEPMGYAIPAPNLQRFAEQGVLLRNCHASAPSCAPSRAALVTGQYPHCCGMLGLPAPKLGYRLNDYSLHLGAWLRARGYHTALAGVQHVAREPMVNPLEVLPYDRFLTGKDDERDNDRVGKAIKFLSEDHERPFFLSVGLLDPHRDNQAPGRGTFIESQPHREPFDIEDRARYCQPWPHMPDTPVARREMANFKMGVASMDADVGRLLTVLDRPDLRDNTLVIFTTDHGPGVCGMKCTLTERGTGVTTVWRGPRDPAYGAACHFTGGRVVDAMCQHLDFYPSLCECLGEEAPAHCQGRSLLPLVRDGVDAIHDAIFSEQTYHYSDSPRPLRSVRTERYRYIRCYLPEMLVGVDCGPAENWWRAHGYGERPQEAEQLFDRYFDPHEANNLATHPEYAEVLAEMRGRMDEWQRETDDPIVHGIPVPPAQAVRS
ncbi:MAG: sulfatase [Planctomycetota bacterium]|jgi:N-sulfoglucosamine sulfohydrolase|nr:sulfatase [Planctomycetota bacterium]